MYRFKCKSCDEWHEGVPGFSADAPLYYYSVPEDERADRCYLDSDVCDVDDAFFFVRGLIEIPVHGLDDVFSWGVWVSLSKTSFLEYMAKFDDADRVSLGPYFGWLSAALPGYPDTENMKTMMHPREPGTRPLIVLEPTDHPLAVEQREGISQARLAEIAAPLMH